MRNALKRQLFLMLAVFSIFAAAPAVAAPTPAAADSCQTDCLRVYSIKTYTYLAPDAQANVQIVDEDVSLIKGAVVHGRWTLPDGTIFDQYDIIGVRGRAEMKLYTDQVGTVTFTVVDVTLAGYTFDAAGSNLLSVSIDIGDPVSDPDPDPTVCATDCLTVDSLTMSERRGDVRALATVVDEDGAAINGVSVDATWTLPDGATETQSLTTNRKGRARFAVSAEAAGSYSITIDDVSLDGFSFVTEGSVLSGTITVD